jgi:Transport protein Trs120 or TRAPPC9, TRAPP II complex subunit
MSENDHNSSSIRDGGELINFSQIPGSPAFRSAATNAVAIIPLLSSDKDGNIATTHSAKSFRDLFKAFDRYCQSVQRTGRSHHHDDKELMLIVPNASLTRPGDWRYDNTPLKFFHWGHGCQRLLVFDGRPEFSRMAHDRVINHGLTRDWIDFCPSRRTAAVIGVLNMRDCVDQSTLHRAEEELQNWSQRYSTPSYEVHAHARGNERDQVVERLFVFDSFDENCQDVDLTKTKFGTNILAFPPSDEAHSQMMDLHLNVVVNDLAVAIFQQLEKRIRESDELKGTGDPGSIQRKNNRITRFLSSDTRGTEEPMNSSTSLSLSSINSVLNPDGANTASSKGVFSQLAESASKATSSSTKDTRQKPVQQLLTPVDEVWDFSNLSAKEAETMKKREVGRREKFAADLCLLAGSPMDAYERYLKAAEMCKSKNPDPLWYAGSMEGCAAAHIAMAEAGGYNVDEYLENNFQLPDEIMALAIATIQDVKKANANKQTLPKIVFTLCEEALHVLARHPAVSCFHAELLLKLVWYCADGEEHHMMCRWGEGDGCYGGDPSGPRRWDKHSVHKTSFGSLKTKEGEDIIISNSQQRLRKWVELMHRACSTGALDASSRVDVGSRCARLCIRGMQVSMRGLI